MKHEVCWQYNLGTRYRREGLLGKVELYYKRYSHLPLWENAGAGPVLTSSGYGYSKGIDLFISDYFFYIGVFIMMGKHAVYDVSNF